MKKGISLVALVITVVVLISLTGIVLINSDDDGIIEEAEKVVDNFKKNELIDRIKERVFVKQLEKETIEHEKLDIEEDVIPILQKYGTYNDETMQLTTEEGITIMLYEIMLLPVEEYISTKVNNGELTIVTTLLSSIGTVQYSIDKGMSWVDYATGTSILAREIMVQLVDKDKKQISDRLEIDDNNNIDYVDTRAPIIVIPPLENAVVKQADITISVLDSGGLSEENDYQYYISTSSTSLVGGEWKEYTNGETFTIGEGLSGIYYIHVKSVKDTSNNESGEYVSVAYNFDSEKPTIAITTTKTTNDTFDLAINLSDNVGIDYTKCKYVLKDSNISLGTNISNYTDGTLSIANKVIELGICGIYYMHIIATDKAGNTNTYVSDVIVGSNLTYGSVENETTYNYINSIQEEKLDKGIYKLEVWGAAGGGTYGGKGGYSMGTLLVENSQDIFVVTGGKGSNVSGVTGGTGGYNGGGKGGNGYSSYSGGDGGGGATHIATASGILSSLSGNRSSVLLVAGGRWSVEQVLGLQKVI